MSAHLDIAELDMLVGHLAAAGERAIVESKVMIEMNTRIVASAARAHASARRDTGDLAASVTSEVHGLTGIIAADPRQGHFLEYGSPNTGPPDPWMSGPAERAQDAMIVTLAKQFGPW